MNALQVIDGFYVKHCKKYRLVVNNVCLQAKHSFPDVIGAIDGCHIDIKAPKENSASYLNRKGKTSMLLQAVCDHNYIFTDCFVGFPGSVHDARVFQKSGMLQHCKNDAYFPSNSHLLGDSAYPVGLHLLTPYKHNGQLTRKQVKYNIIHAGTRVTIEGAFGLLKGRWRRLMYLDLHCTDKYPSTIIAACVLHNFGIKHNDKFNVEVEDVSHNISQQFLTYSSHTQDKEAIQKRNCIADMLYH